MGSYLSHFMSFWSAAELNANIIIFLNLAGAMLLGFVVGYERSYHGRAAGMRTYGLVCMASAALVVIAGYPDFWYGGRAIAPVALDPTRIIQGIVTGIGFLGAGVIMKEGFTISGLTTAASVWASSAIGVLVGVGFYAAAILLALLSAACMVWVHRLESWLPSQAAIVITIRFKKGFLPDEKTMGEMALRRGYEMASGTLAIAQSNGALEWRFVAVAMDKKLALPISVLSQDFEKFDGVDSFQLSHARN
ncbi:MgtC/SapB family protein [Undibacterium sp. FT79W]|jgi:putative Mg2+ transporter-C (MgtC) family protein|uniref:Protein MgtC n=2 Tax=Oxalobacteraceae TaxID=75682 RepID=A0ABR6XD73_9BURK|nr:MgtC/SapB family protein [Undibacterium aquatile]MBC3877244.1 MgtC/SapB family protein [Undibacterium sp. FT79W]MBC3927006.1 MgtC/SapB family protein [Undibacterium sp. CY21W]MBK1888840.1 MgtC/SapB family protein [Undibacterium sp. 14-3-2]MBY0569651.1 MgtC/SapB family protein [Burkholderiaceae bacterium]